MTAPKRLISPNPYIQLTGEGDVTVTLDWGMVRLNGRRVDAVIDEELYLDHPSVPEHDRKWHSRVASEVKFYTTKYPNSRIARSVARQLTFISGKLGTLEIANWCEFDVSFERGYDDEDIAVWMRGFKPTYEREDKEMS